MLHRTGPAPLRMGYRTCSAGDAGLRQSRQFAGTGVAEIGDGPAHLVAEQADIAWYESHWMPPETIGRLCRIRPVRRRAVPLRLESSRPSALDVQEFANPYSMVMVEPPSTQYSTPPPLDRIAVRRIFARAGDGDPEFARVMLTARDALLERLDGIRIAPTRILDLGAGTGATARRLARRFRRAEVVSADPVASLLHRARSRAPRWFSRHRYVTAEAERLPLASHTMDLILSSVAMPWFDPVDHALAECLRTLRPGG